MGECYTSSDKALWEYSNTVHQEYKTSLERQNTNRNINDLWSNGLVLRVQV